MWYYIIEVFHVLVCLFLIGVVLLQSGKAADLAGAFGGMGSQTAFGPRGATTLLHKLTTGSAIVFMVTSLTLSILATNERGGSSVLERSKASAPKQAPAKTSIPTPGAPAPGEPMKGPGGAQPSVTLTDEKTGASKTVPLNIPAPGAAPQSAPKGQPAPGKK
jgi:preprotein translocase subunit SecG